jgi:hypothetical protein
VAAASFPVIMLIHDALMPIFLPLIFFRFLVDMGAPIQRGRVVALSMACICVLTVFMWIQTFQLSEASATALYESLQARAEYPLRRDVFFDVLARSSVDHVSQFRQVWSVLFGRFAVNCWIVTLPTIAYLLHGALVNLAHQGRSRVVQGMAIIASLAPLSIHAIGGDSNRWTTLAITTSFLVYAVTAMRFRTQVETFPSISRRRIFAAVALMGINVGASFPLLDSYVVDNFPYPRLVQNVIDIIDGEASFPPEPERCTTSGACFTVIQSGKVKSAVTPEELRDASRVVVYE